MSNFSSTSLPWERRRKVPVRISYRLAASAAKGGARLRELGSDGEPEGGGRCDDGQGDECEKEGVLRRHCPRLVLEAGPQTEEDGLNPHVKTEKHLFTSFR